MNDNSAPNSKTVRIQLWANFFPASDRSGAGAYINSIVHYLSSQPDLKTEIHLLRPAGTIPPQLANDLSIRVWPSGYREGATASLLQNVYRELKGAIPGWMTRIYSTLTPHWFRNKIHRARTGLTTAAVQTDTGETIREFAPEDRVLLRQILADESPDCVIVSYAWMADLLQLSATSSHCLRVIVSPDVLHQRYLTRQDVLQEAGTVEWTKVREAACLRSADLIVAIQNDDADVFREMCPEIPVIVASYARSVVTLPAATASAQCLFVGSASDHNIQGLQWFAKTVWPIVVRRIPHARLIVAGNVGTKFMAPDSSIQVLGIVERLDDLYRQTNVCVIPLQFGSGLKIKLIDALAYGRACVSTSVGLQGVDFLQDHGVMRAESAEEFAAAVIRLIEDQQLRDEQERLAHAAIEQWFSANACYASLVQSVREAVDVRRNHRVGTETR